MNLRVLSNFVVPIVGLFLLTFPLSIWGATFQDFDALPVTELEEAPGSGGDWLYTTATSNPDPRYPMTHADKAGWRNTQGYPTPHEDIHNFFTIYLNGYNSSHMGFETYGFLEIDDVITVKGHSLRYVVTGGKNETTLPEANGLRVTTKENYLEYLQQGQNPIEGGMLVGHPYLYFQNTSPNDNPVAFPEAQESNRLSLYIYAPATLTNGSGGWERPPRSSIHIGPYTGVGGHWYHQINTQGGGWMHVLVDGHPQHNNAWHNAARYPYPSKSLRDLGSEYFAGMYRFYITFKPYSGIGVSPYSVWFDEIEFLYDPEPQNTETINSPSVVYFPTTRSFEIGFMDKYKDNPHSYSTYEVRYAFSPISNENWQAATPVHILADARFGIEARTDGKFGKWWPYYQSVWTPFTLASEEDTANLVPGTRIYFAVKDISQVDGDSQVPVASLTGRESGGRDYVNHGETFDYEGDQAVLKLIKRIDYFIPPLFHNLTVTKTGSGYVSSEPARMTCGMRCSESYKEGMVVTLTAVPESGSTFAGWSGACNGNKSCTVTMDMAKEVVATFVPNTSYFGFEEFGGMWHDAELSQGDKLSWAAAAANILQWAGWGTPECDIVEKIFGNLEEYWTNEDGLMEYGWRWWLNGYTPTETESLSQVNDSNEGNYWPEYNFFDYFYEDWVNFSTGQWSEGSHLMGTIDEYLHSGYGVTLAAYGDGVQGLSVWGYEYDEAGSYTGLWVTDSKDTINNLILLSVELVGDLWYLDLKNDYGYKGWFIGEVQALGHKPVPEPSTLYLIALGVIGLIWFKRGRGIFKSSW